MKKVFLATLFFFQLAYSQNNEKAIEGLIEDFTRTQFTIPDSSYHYIRKALGIAQKGNSPQLSNCLFYMGRYFYNEGNPAKAKQWFSKSLNLAIKTNNKKALALNYNLLGLIEMDNGNYTYSLRLLLKSLDIADKNHLAKNKCNALNNLGTLYELQKDTLKALKCYTDNVEIAKANDFDEVLLYSYMSLGIINRATNKDDAVKYYNLAYGIADKLNDDYQKASILVNTSEVYLSTDLESNYAKAFACLNKLKEIETRTNSQDHLFYYYFNMGAYYSKTKNYSNSVTMYLEALKLSKGAIATEQKINLFHSISKVYKKSGNFEKAVVFLEKYHALQDSVFSVKKTKAFDEIQTKYEVEKKNLKIDLLSREKIIEKTKKRIVIYVGLALVIPLLALVLFYRNRIKLQKVIQEKENELFLKEKTELQQQQELERITGIVEGQDQERNRFAKEIHDGVGGDLAGIKLQLHQINSSLQSEPINEIINHLGNVFVELRNISHDLSLTKISDKSLETLLFELTKEYENREEFATELIIFPDGALDKLSSILKHHIYRIIQELLANVSKHANAKNVLLSFTKMEDNLNIILEDDGCGFEVTDKNGIGLKNIQERLAAINGTMAIESMPKGGTSVIIDILDLKL
ncbi:tetratricopeptide repeat-containing sensor histidine kinase [Flavobacterium wongokense]|uniref:tetratricopeptide repeat-containing sensor histidine kinase n=1 Tax=Flavobacterium wongokense TaxID=2910674 RepID=UPI001F3FB933|nr:tetratricopeptide repeat protein [Flavobacterium sp. WG47]MCF6130832.1 sensor histidine kinase [Flavobacterium sp. WG47]